MNWIPVLFLGLSLELWLGGGAASAAAITNINLHTEEPQDPDYAKWSSMAFHEAGKLYELLDYKYLGHSHPAPGVDQQQFRFWVKKSGQEFPLIVTIRYDPVTQKVFTLVMEEEKRGNLQLL